LRISFADEARFGRMNRPRPCWAPDGTRPQLACQLVREYVYLYGAVSPKDNTCVYLILPAPDTQCFEIFLETLAKKYPRQFILLFVDGAGNYHGDDLDVPAKIMLHFLPPYSPKLIPQETLWDETREKIFKNYALKSMMRSTQSLWTLHSTSNAIRVSLNPSLRSPSPDYASGMRNFAAAVAEGPRFT
jgi:transposase